MGKADLSWFMDGSGFKRKVVSIVLVIPLITTFEVTEATSLPLATLAQQAKSYASLGLHFSPG